MKPFLVIALTSVMISASVIPSVIRAQSTRIMDPSYADEHKETAAQIFQRECGSGQNKDCVAYTDSGGTLVEDDKDKIPVYEEPSERTVDTRRVGQPTPQTLDRGADTLPDIPGTGASD